MVNRGRPVSFGNGNSLEAIARDRSWFWNLGTAVKAFGYWSDPLFIVASVAYALNRWMLKPLLAIPFLRGHFNDLLLIPAALPLVLWLQRKFNLRHDDSAPEWREIGLHVLVWSLICEVIGPMLLHRGTADVWDVVAYVAGGIAAGIWWNRTPSRSSPAVR